MNVFDNYLQSLNILIIFNASQIIENVSDSGNYIIFRKYIKCVLPPLTEVVDPTN